MKLTAEQGYDLNWYAIDEDRYDGSPDAHPYDKLVGIGKTPEKAIEDLEFKISELENYV